MSGKKIESEKEALSLARNAIENAACEGPFMVAVFYVKEGEVFIDRSTWDFPKTKMGDAIELLEKNLEEERTQGPMLSDAPLPDAPIVADQPPVKHTPIELPTIKFPLDADMEEDVVEPAPQLDDEGPVPATPDDLGGIVEVTDPQPES